MIDKQDVISLLSNTKLTADGNIRANCPWCNKNEFYINVNKSHFPFQCWRKNACGVEGNLFKLLKYLNRLDLLPEKDNLDISQNLELLVKQERYVSPVELTELPTCLLPVGFKRIYSNEYLESRNFFNFEKYKVGTTSLLQKFRDYVIIVIEQNEKEVAFVSRYTGSDKDCVRYKNSVSDFESILFGLDDITNETEVIIVEGIFDKINIDYRLELDKSNKTKCVCTFGAKISDKQIQLLKSKNIKDVILFFDNDVPDKVVKYYNILSQEFDKVWLTYNRELGKDVADLNTAELLNLIINPVSLDNYFVDCVKVKKL